MRSAGVELIHVDVMDGHFVPNITIGIPVVAALRKKTDLPLDVHLMICNPLFYAPRFADVGADIIVFHVESDCEPQAVLDAIKASGVKSGIALKPNTPAEAVFPYLSQLDMVLVMTVEPGFGGQSFMEDMCPKISELRSRRDRLGLSFDIQVDGGISCLTAPLVVGAGANVLVAGSSLFGAEDYSEAVSLLKKSAFSPSL